MDTEPSNPPSFSAPKRWGLFLSLLVGVFAFMAIVVMANYLGLRHSRRFVLTPLQETQLHQPTRNLLRSVTNAIQITVLIDKQDAPDLHELVTRLLKEYAYACPLISIREISPSSDFGEAQAILKGYGLEGAVLTNRNFIVVAANKDKRVINDNELAELDISQLLSGASREIGLKDFKGEQAISSAIFALSNPRKVKAYFLQGHGEHSPSDLDGLPGYGAFASLLKNQLNIACETLSLAITNEVPADCQLLIIAGPQSKYPESEKAAIQAYLKSGGRAFVLLNNLYLSQERSGIEDVLEKWGVGVADCVVHDPKFAPNHSESDLLVNYPTNSTDHPVAKPLIRLGQTSQIWLCAPRMVGPHPNATKEVDPPRITYLAVSSSDGSYTTRDLQARNPFMDLKNQTFPLIVSVEKGGIAGVNDRNTRLIVVGDSLCLAKDRFGWPANQYFASLAANWLTERPQEMLDIAAQPLNQYRVMLSRTRSQQLQWLLLAAIPGSILLLGCVVWLRRRS